MPPLNDLDFLTLSMFDIFSSISSIEFFKFWPYRSWRVVWSLFWLTSLRIAFPISNGIFSGFPLNLLAYLLTIASLYLLSQCVWALVVRLSNTSWVKNLAAAFPETFFELSFGAYSPKNALYVFNLLLITVNVINYVEITPSSTHGFSIMKYIKNAMVIMLKTKNM